MYWGLLDREFLFNYLPGEVEAEVKNVFDTVLLPVAIDFGHIVGAQECKSMVPWILQFFAFYSAISGLFGLPTKTKRENVTEFPGFRSQNNRVAALSDCSFE
jgi:hypothetical protein